jgi:hypothetical protein
VIGAGERQMITVAWGKEGINECGASTKQPLTPTEGFFSCGMILEPV